MDGCKCNAERRYLFHNVAFRPVTASCGGHSGLFDGTYFTRLEAALNHRMSFQTPNLCSTAQAFAFALLSAMIFYSCPPGGLSAATKADTRSSGP